MNFWPAARPPLTPKENTEPGPSGRYFLRPLEVRVRGQAGEVHVGHALVRLEPFGHGLGVLQVLVQALRERFHALQQLERRLRGQRRADVAQLLAAQLGQEPVLAEVAPPGDVAVGGHRLGHGGELAVAPVEPAAFDDHAAQGGAVAAEELGGGVDHDVRAVLDRPHEVRRAQGGVDDEGDAGVVRHLRQARQGPGPPTTGWPPPRRRSPWCSPGPPRRSPPGRCRGRTWCPRRSGAASRPAG